MNKKGFTLIELIVVIAILAVLGLLLVPQISGYVESSKATTCANNRKLIERSITLAETKGINPTSLISLEAIANIDGLYDGGKVCPDGNENILIANGTVTCKKHGDSSGSNNPEHPNPENSESSFCIAGSKYCVTNGIFDFSNYGVDSGKNVVKGQIQYYKGKYYMILENGNWFDKNTSESDRENYLTTSNHAIEINLASMKRNDGSKSDIDFVRGLNPGDVYIIDGKTYVRNKYINNHDSLNSYGQSIQLEQMN